MSRTFTRVNTDITRVADATRVKSTALFTPAFMQPLVYNIEHSMQRSRGREKKGKKDQL